jgi:hypothetical protein
MVGANEKVGSNYTVELLEFEGDCSDNKRCLINLPEIKAPGQAIINLHMLTA